MLCAIWDTVYLDEDKVMIGPIIMSSIYTCSLREVAINALCIALLKNLLNPNEALPS